MTSNGNGLTVPRWVVWTAVLAFMGWTGGTAVTVIWGSARVVTQIDYLVEKTKAMEINVRQNREAILVNHPN